MRSASSMQTSCFEFVQIIDVADQASRMHMMSFIQAISAVFGALSYEEILQKALKRRGPIKAKLADKALH